MNKLFDLQQWPFNKLVLIYFLTFFFPPNYRDPPPSSS